ncbi:MAG: alpha-amylase family glycosyl hydrolase [Rhodocyclaceae bacterium]
MNPVKRFLLCVSILWAVSSAALAAPWMGHLEIRDNAVWNGGRAGNYGTVKYYLDETAGEKVPVQVMVQVYGDGRPATDLEVQVFSNINRRDQAKVWEDPNQAGGATSYYLTYPMTQVGQTGNNFIFRADLTLAKTGAYRVTTRFRLRGGDWQWHNDFDVGGVKQRDCAVVVSPRKVLGLSIYEANPLVVEAKPGGSFEQRSTFEDFTDHDQDGFDPFNLRFVRERLGFNTLWLMPIFPNTTERWDPNARQFVPNYSPGSPYAARNYFAANEWLSRANTPGAAMSEFQHLVNQADALGLNVFLDVAFNHAGRDVVFGQGAVDLGLVSPADINKLVRTTRPAWFSKASDYRQHAGSPEEVTGFAPADRRGEHNWYDAGAEWFFGSYASLGPKPGYGEIWAGGALDERDLFFTDLDPAGGHDIEVENVFNYFARILTFWLDQTGNKLAGIRADFAQGLPPQAWEYIINKTRQKKWDFVFLAEALDPDGIRYRVNRHFDLLTTVDHWLYRNNGVTMSQLAGSLEGEAQLYGYNASVLHNGTSHDEDGNANAWLMMARYAVAAANHGVPMAYMGQPLGVPYKVDFQNSWQDLKSFWDNANPQVFGLYGRINEARRAHPALRSTNRNFLTRQYGGGFNENIFSVARWEGDDIVLAFVNLRDGVLDPETFAIPAAVPIRSDARYQAVNLVADNPNQSLWPATRRGSDILQNGVFVRFNFPNEVQYLLLKRQ